MFGDAGLKELQMRKVGVLVDCARDRLALTEQVQRTGAGFARFRGPFGWLDGARSFFGRGSAPEGAQSPSWNWPAMVQGGLKAYAAYQAVRGFFARRREKQRERGLMGRFFSK